MEGGVCRSAFTRDIAASSGVPPAYLAKILRKLSEGGILEAKRGRSGGVRLARDPSQVTLLEIARTIDGEGFLPTCLLGESFCEGGRVCPCEPFWKEERVRIERELNRISLADIIACGNGAARAVSVASPAAST